MTPADDLPRDALLAGATGLIGHALLALLRQSERYRSVRAWGRRPPADLPADAKLRFERVDFSHLPEPFPRVDDVFIALGTTIKVAGSQQAFRQVDHDFVVDIARAARQAGARRLAVVSAMGANAGSRIFYNRVKGEMQQDLARLGYETLVIAQPSLLIGDRAALGQPLRRGEVLAANLFGPITRLLPRHYRPIAASAVAAAMLGAMLEAGPGVRVLRSGQMQPGVAR